MKLLSAFQLASVLLFGMTGLFFVLPGQKSTAQDQNQTAKSQDEKSETKNPAAAKSSEQKSSEQKSSEQKSSEQKSSEQKSSEQKSSGATADAPETESYPDLMNQWKQKEDQLKKLEAEFKVAGETRKTEIRSEFNVVLDEVNKLVPRLRKKAIETYQENPNQDESLVRLLIGMLTDDLQKDRSDDFFALGNVLIEGKCDIEHLKALDKSKRLIAFGVSFAIEELIARFRDAEKSDLPRAIIKTSYGDIEIELFEDSAPNHVANFISLAAGNRYDGSKWHRDANDPNIIRGGQPKDGNDVNYTLAGEWNHPNRRRHFKGHIGAVRDEDPNSAGSQFYITTDRVPQLDASDKIRTVFGRVTSGMEFVHQIKEDDEILSVTVTSQRKPEYKPKPYQPADENKKDSAKTQTENQKKEQDLNSSAKSPEKSGDESKKSP